MNKRRRWKAKARRKAGRNRTSTIRRIVFHPQAFEMAMAPLSERQMADVIYGIGYFRDGRP